MVLAVGSVKIAMAAFVTSDQVGDGFVVVDIKKLFDVFCTIFFTLVLTLSTFDP